MKKYDQDYFWNTVVQKKVLLAPFTTFKIGGPAKYFVEAKNSRELQLFLQFARAKSIPVFVLGKGSNILMSSHGFDGLVIKNSSEQITFERDRVIVDSGVDLQELIRQAANRGLSGFEHFSGIPSTIGGALWQNIHFLSPDRKRTIFIEEIFHSAHVFNQLTGEVKIFLKQDFALGYDESILRQNEHLIVLSAQFILEKKSQHEIQEIITQNFLWRQERHPPFQTEPSAGSIFKKIDGIGAGRLIEQVGMKGFSIRGAVVSKKHANFIINQGNATSDDVSALINKIQERVYLFTGYELETEIKFVGM